MTRFILIAAPTLIGLAQLDPDSSGYLTAGVTLVFFAFATKRAVLLARPYALNGPLFAAAGFFLALMIVACFRSGITLIALLWISVALCLATALLPAVGTETARKYREAVVWSPIAFVAVNFLLMLAGLANPRAMAFGHQTPEVLRALGFGGDRTLFPLAQGFGDFGDVAALGFAASCVLVLSRGHRRSGAIALIVCAFALLAADTRGPMIAAIIGVVAAVLLRSGQRWLSLLIPFTAVLAVTALSAVASLAVVENITRQGTQTDTASGRVYVWQTVWDQIKHADIGDNLVGYGAFGPYQAGVADRYAIFLPSQTETRYGSAHNLALQTVMDVGIVGLVALVVVFFLALDQLGRMRRRNRGDPTLTAMIAFLVALMILGASDTAPTIYSPQALEVWLAVVFASMRPLRLDVRRTVKPKAPPTPAPARTPVPVG